MKMLFFSAFGLSLALWAVPGAVTTGALLSRLESLYDHVLARGRWYDIAGERF